MDFKNERLMMSEEEIRKRAKELLNENQADLIIKYMFLEQQAKKQKEVIIKAVLELVNIDGDLSNSQLSDRICNLIDILEGEDKEVLE
jgi:hypothetical protein